MKQKLHLAIAMLLTLFAVTITSCGGDKKDEPDSSNPLIGTWKKNTIYHPYDCDAKSHVIVYEFKKNGTGCWYEEHPNGDKCASTALTVYRPFKWSSTPVEIHFIYEDGGSCARYYTLSGNTIHLIDYDGEDLGVFVRK